MTRILAGAVIAALSFVATATPAFAQSGESAVRGAIETLVPNAKIDSVSESVVPNLYEVTIEGRVVYVTADGAIIPAKATAAATPGVSPAGTAAPAKKK